jgi:hypothetical protein
VLEKPPIGDVNNAAELPDGMLQILFYIIVVPNI